MNNFGKFSFLLLISFIIQLKCSDEKKEEIILSGSFFEMYNKSRIENINKTNFTINEQNNANNSYTYEISEKIYFGKIKYYNKTTAFRNYPTENGNNFCFNCSNNNSTFTKMVDNAFVPWPNKENNNNIEFISVIDFEFDQKGNIYILDEGDNNSSIKLYKFDIEFKDKKEYPILPKEKVYVTNFVIDTKSNYVYIAYYSLIDNKNDIQLGIIFKDLTGSENTITMVPLKNIKIKDDNYELPQYFMRYIEFLDVGNSLTIKVFSKLGTIDFNTIVISSPLEDRFVVELDYNAMKLTPGDELPLVDAIQKLIIHKNDETIIAETVEITTEFMKISCDTPLNVGEDFDCELNLPDDYGTISFKANVIYNDIIYDNEYKITFYSMNEADRQTLLYFMYVYANSYDKRD